MPIEDSLLVLQHGNPKEARWVPFLPSISPLPHPPCPRKHVLESRATKSTNATPFPGPESRFIPERLHMGYPEANSYVYPWLEGVLG